MLAATFPWDVAIVALSTLVAGLGATWWSTRTQRANQFMAWRAEQQRAASEQLLRAFSELYGRLSLIGKRPVRSGKPMAGDDWSDWRAAIERISLVGDPAVVRRVVDLDYEIWKLHTAVLRLDALHSEEWREFTAPVHDARAAFVKAVRGALGYEEGGIEERGGKPDPDDPIWTGEYWEAARRRVAGSERGRLDEEAEPVN